MTQLVILIIYMAALLGLGLLANRWFRGTSQDYMLASHSIGPFFLLMSLFGTTMTAFALVGSTGKAYTLGVGVYGMLASASGIIHSLCFFLIGLKLWGLGRRYGYTTQIQFFRDRLQSDKIGLLLFPVLVGLVIPYLLIGVLASGTVISKVTTGAFADYGWFADFGHGVPPQIASLVVCLVVLTYVFFGGMRGTAWANAFQTMVFMILGVVTFVVIANGLGGTESILENMRRASQAVSADHLSRVKIPKPVYFSFLLIPASVAMFPHVFQHWLTAKSARTFKAPIILHPIFILIVWLPCVLVGVWASASSSGLPTDIPENAVLAALVHRLADPLLGGLLAAGILAAIMSSLDSQFLCLGTMFTTDIVKHYGKGQTINDQRTVLIARGFVVLIVSITYVLSLYPPANIFDMAIWCFSGFVGLFPLVVGALYWRRLTAAGAAASVLTCVVSWGVMFYRSGYGMKRYAFPESPLPSAEMMLVPPMMPVVSIFVFSLVAMVVVSLVTRPPSDETLRKFFPEAGS